MNEVQVEAAAQLARADRLGAEARRGGRWYVRYLLVFGVASFVLAAVFAFVDNSTAVVVGTPLWIVFVVGISVWAATRRVGLRGFGALTAWSCRRGPRLGSQRSSSAAIGCPRCGSGGSAEGS
ncbi:hypothetical protein [Saccharopolyspora pogona]|uniref:hypothetical protein n=1 Tax=Saccharopolyspora pogona TaxID=333966 RepID=UPI001687F70B|nr:hypothetical protein [Saccharopolyspora pogona]